MRELWRSIPGWYPYEASNIGRIRNGDTGLIRAMHSDPKSIYFKIGLWSDGKTRTQSVSHLVCLAWHGLPIGNKNDAAHLDGSRTNNNWHNLKWKTRKENMMDRDKHKRTMKGSLHVRTKLTDKKVKELRERYANLKINGRIPRGARIIEARRYGLSFRGLHHIISRRCWKHI